MMITPNDDRAHLERAIAALESQRSTLGDEAVDETIQAIRKKMAEPQETPPVECRKQVTILFADLVGFTELVEKKDPEDVKEIMERYFTKWSECIAQFDGVVEKYIGDAVMAVYGMETYREDAPENAVKSALHMLSELDALNEVLNERYQIRLDMRVGINTGLVFVGSLGDGRDGPKVVGDAVNIASRLETAGPAGGILISQTTYDHIRGLFDIERWQPLVLKGVAKPLNAYRVLKEKPRGFRMATRRIGGIVTKTVGRETELSILQETYLKASQGGGLQWLTITGEAGVGKSRLFDEFEQWLELRREKIWYLKGRAWAHTQHSPYYVLRDLFSFRFAIEDGDQLPLAREKLVRGFQLAMGEQLGEEAGAFVGQLIGFDFHQDPWIVNIAKDTKQIRGRAEVLLQKYFECLCRASPVVCLLEDLHWADSESLSILFAVLAKPRTWKMCVAMSMRPLFWDRETLRGWGEDNASAHHPQHLELRPLGEDSAHELAREILQKADSIPSWLLNLLVQRGEGNPYFTEELVHWLIEQGVVEIREDEWKIADREYPDLSVPTTVQGVLQARLERLSTEERAILEPAAVVGRAFWNGAVSSMIDEPLATEQWDRLMERDFIVRQPQSQLMGEEEYLFKHILLRDVVYECTLKSLRRSFHRQAAHWMERKTADRADEWASVIAAHHEQAGNVDEAAVWYGRAAKHAQMSHALEAALRYYERALSSLPELKTLEHRKQEVSWCEGMGRVLFDLARYPEAAKASDAMRIAAEAGGDEVAQARAWNRMGEAQSPQGMYRPLIESSKRAREIAQGLGSSGEPEMARALCNEGWGHRWLGDPETAYPLAKEGYALSKKVDDRSEMGYAVNLLGALEYDMGNYQRARSCFDKAREIYEKLGNRSRVMSILNNLGELARARGELRSSVAFYERGLAIAREIGNLHGQWQYTCNLAAAWNELGDYKRAEKALRHVIHITGESGRLMLAETYSFLAFSYLGQHRAAEALEAAQTALALSLKTGARPQIGMAWRALGMCAAQRESPVPIDKRSYSAGECFAESCSVLKEAGLELETAKTLHVWGRHERAKGDADKGRCMLEEAAEVFRKMGVPEPPPSPQDA